MLVHRLRLVNFRQHEDTDLRFGPGLTGVIGPNGAGKTTLLEALAWALYGTKAARGTADSIRRRNAPARARVEVTLELSLGAHRYRVTRSLHGAEPYQDTDPAPIANSSDAVTERLGRILGMTRDEFFNTYFTGQRELAIMGSMTPSERERFLSRVLGYERLAAAQKRLSADRSVLRARLQALESTLVSPAELGDEERGAAGQLAGARVAAALATTAQQAAAAELAVIESLAAPRAFRQAQADVETPATIYHVADILALQQAFEFAHQHPDGAGEQARRDQHRPPGEMPSP